MQYFRISENQFSGPIPDRFGEINEFNETGLNNLIAFDVSDNSFSGPIPASLVNLEAIRVINLQYNQFTGAVPGDLCDIRGDTVLAMLKADCGGKDSPNECTCCTSCCDREEKICEVVEERRLSNQKVERWDDEAEAEEAKPPNVYERGIPKRRKLQSVVEVEANVPSIYERGIPERRKLQSDPDCTARRLWERDTGRLVLVVD